MGNEEILQLAETLWNYHRLIERPQPADCIIGLGSVDTRVAEYAADLYLNKMAPLLVFTGGFGNYSGLSWKEPEAEVFARIARDKGVPSDEMLLEKRSTNTGDNIRFTAKLLAENNISVDSLILVHKPYMERRTFATFARQWPGKRFFVTSPPIPFNRYPTPEIPLDQLINNMVGDLERICIYPERGFQVYQEIPGDVMDAAMRLQALGFTKYLPR